MNNRAKFIGSINPAINKNLHARMIRLDRGGTGVMIRVGPFLATVSEDRATAFADAIIDALEAGPPPKAPRRRRPPRGVMPLYTSRSATLTAADGTPEEPLPATPAENE